MSKRYTWREVRAIAAQNGINDELPRRDLLAALEQIGINIGLHEITGAIRKVLQESFQALKDIFSGGIWVRFYLDENNKVRVKITLGENGPAITRRDLNQTEANEVIQAINTGDFNTLRNYTRKISRVNRLIIEAKKSNA